MTEEKDKVVSLYDDIPLYGEIHTRIVDYVYDQCDGLPLVMVLGILDLVKDQIKDDNT